MAFIVESYVQDLIARLEAARDSLPEYTAEACNDIANKAVEDLVTQAPYDAAADNGVIPGEEGHLADSFYALEAIASGPTAQTQVITQEPIKFGYVTEGTESPILPVTKHALWWPDAPHPMASVSGQEPNDFAQKVYDEILATYPTIVAGAFQPFFDFLRSL